MCSAYFQMFIGYQNSLPISFPCQIFQLQFSSITQLCPTLCDPMDCSMSGLPVHHQLPEFTQTHVQWVDDAIQPSHPLLSPCSPTFNLSQHQGLSSRLALRIRWPKYWSFSFSISPSNEYSGLISFKMDWFNLFAVQAVLTLIYKYKCFVWLLSGS